jgi:hypothetical protein
MQHNIHVVNRVLAQTFREYLNRYKLDWQIGYHNLLKLSVHAKHTAWLSAIVVPPKTCTSKPAAHQIKKIQPTKP